MEMEGSVRSEGVIKKKSSSGCLIVKRKDSSKKAGGGSGGFGNSGKEKKRPKVVESVSGSSDEDESLEFMLRKVNDKRLSKGSMECKRSKLGHSENHRDDVEVGNNCDIKRNGLGLFDFDEYDEFDEKMIRNEYVEDRVKTVQHGADREKRKQGSRDKGIELEDDEANMPISSLKLNNEEKANEAVRLQGKNGVLKVMMTTKKRNVDPVEVDERKTFKSKVVSKRGSFVDEEEVKFEKVKPMLSKGKRTRESEMDSNAKDKVDKLTPSSSKKQIVKKVERSPSPEDVTPVKEKARKNVELKRGGSTEKQMLREKIKGILLDAGWTIDYRPRRNRDYLDSVYINPSGTAYWSIVKAYDAFKKQLGEGNHKSKSDHKSPSLAPVSDDLLHKLTRRTKKKVEEEFKRKRKVAGLKKSVKRSSTREASKSSDSDQNEDESNEDESSDDLPTMRSRKVTSHSNIFQGRTSTIIGRPTLLVHGSDKAETSASDGYVPYNGKRTILGWLIDSGTAQLSEKLQYMNRKRTTSMLKGWITRDGIHCGCCSKILSVSKFELHAGSKLRQPFQNIYLESGSSLLQCQVDAWKKQDQSLRRDFHVVNVDGGEPDDDTCGICGDGGDLICCDSCPSTFHQSCLGLQILPSDDWYCPDCTCKFCGDSSGKAAGENDSIVDELIGCSFCEKKYHKSCSEKMNDQHVISNDTSFCGPKCQELYDHLHKVLGVKHELEAGFSWSLIRRTDVSDTLLRVYHQRVECNSKLAVALSVMDECFLPIIDRRSGFNMIHNAVYNCGSNFKRLDFRGFYTAILERGDELVAAACIRIHGTRLAEMPFIGTRGIYRRQGMCRRLLSAIESELKSLKVENLIIPAVSEHMDTWTTVFGFHQLDDSLKKEMKSMSMLVFPGTDMLQKQLLKHEISEAIGIKVSDPKKQPDSPEKRMELDKQQTDDTNCLPPPLLPNDKDTTKRGDTVNSPSRGAEVDIAPQVIVNNDLFVQSSGCVTEISAQNPFEVNLAILSTSVLEKSSSGQLTPDTKQLIEPLMENPDIVSTEVSR